MPCPPMHGNQSSPFHKGTDRNVVFFRLQVPIEYKYEYDAACAYAAS
jgi:hypothetical protein